MPGSETVSESPCPVTYFVLTWLYVYVLLVVPVHAVSGCSQGPANPSLYIDVCVTVLHTQCQPTQADVNTGYDYGLHVNVLLLATLIQPLVLAHRSYRTFTLTT